MNKNSHEELLEFAQLFCATESISIGLLNYKTLAHVIRQAVSLPETEYHSSILDRLYPNVSRDEFAFIESLYKINHFVSGEETTQRLATKDSLLRTAEKIDNLVSQDSELDQFVMLSNFPDSHWQQKLTKKPANNNSGEAAAHIPFGLSNDVDQQPSEEGLQSLRRAVLFALRSGFFRDLGGEDCGNPDCPVHGHSPEPQPNNEPQHPDDSEPDAEATQEADDRVGCRFM